MLNLKIIVREQLAGYYWRVEYNGNAYGPAVNTAATKKQARAQAVAFILEELAVWGSPKIDLGELALWEARNIVARIDGAFFFGGFGNRE